MNNVKVKDIIKSLEEWAPLSYQESYDNSGLLIGNYDDPVDNILVTLDVTEGVVQEAIDKNCRMIIAHHPLIFKGLKKITNQHWVERCVSMAIKNDISIYAIHTNLDNVHNGVNQKICEKLGLQDIQILSPKDSTLSKLVTFIPENELKAVLDNMFKAGAGKVGEYDHCSFQVEGIGTFRPGEDTNPHIGEPNKEETVQEKRVEVIFPTHLSENILKALNESHPYEEVAYYLTQLSNKNQEVGSGMVGDLPKAMRVQDFLEHLKNTMDLKVIRHTNPCLENIKKVAVCGGSGSFLLSVAKSRKADIFITGDFKYHDFFEADGKIIIADIGHYESEVFTKDLIHDFLQEKFANIAVRLSEVITNPTFYTY